jgi:hypothetical protein
VSQPSGRDSIQSSSRRRARSAGEVGAGGAGPGQEQVRADGRVEDVRVLRAAADHGVHLAGVIAGQVAAVQGDRAGAQVGEPEQVCMTATRTDSPIVSGTKMK